MLNRIVEQNTKIGMDEEDKNIDKDKAPSWNDVGGLFDAKRKLKEIIDNSVKYSFLFKDNPKMLNAGILLYGPPGWGKTFLATAMAKDFKIISVKGPELLDKYIGSSEARVRELFEKAEQSKPWVLFFDEFDALVPKRGSGATGVTDRIVNQFLCYLDGVEDTRTNIIIAASSRPDMIDKALLRPGRIDKAILWDYPNYDERLETLELYTKKLRADVVIDEEDENDLDLKKISELTENYSYADLKGLICNSQLKAIDRIVEYNRQSFKKKSSSDNEETNDIENEEEGMINTNLIDSDKVYFKQKDIIEAYEEMGSKWKKSKQDYNKMIIDDVKKQKQILM